MYARAILPALVCAAGFLACGETPPAVNAPFHWHVGPFVERDAASAFFAVRPFWCDAGATNRQCDVVWPLATTHGTDEALWWRFAFLFYGDVHDAPRPDWSANLFPLWFCGRDRRTGDGYCALFPLYGEHPRLLGLENFRFALWPLYHAYETKGVRSRSVLWPLVSWKDEPREAFSVWPIWGTAHSRESRHAYCLWPLATWARYAEDRDTAGAGSSWTFWPLAGGVSRVRENQWLVLPPFFSYVETPETTRWRLPWPLVEIERGVRRDRTSVWPLVEHETGYPTAAPRTAAQIAPDENTWRFGWKLVENSRLETEGTRENRFTFFPFFTRETRQRRASGGTWQETASFLRVWPFCRFSSQTRNGRTESHWQTLDLVPVRHADALSRNWAPFWTFWRRDVAPDGTLHETFFFDFFFRTRRPDAP